MIYTFGFDKMPLTKKKLEDIGIKVFSTTMTDKEIDELFANLCTDHQKAIEEMNRC